MSDFTYDPGNEDDDEDAGTVRGNLPSYMIAAANHSTGNLNQEWYEENPDAGFGTRAANMIGSAAISGLNSFRNTAIAVGNIFSDEQSDYVKTEDAVAAFDEDMGKYYEANRSTADLIGFAVTSLVPGTAGVKVFNAGAKALMAAKGGAFGGNMAKGMGILPGARQTLVAEAAQMHATSSVAFSLTNGATVKAMAAGFGENVLQSAAFEIAVAATMSKSPILEDMDIGDLVGNIVTGALVGGAIGGVIDAARSVSGIKKGIVALDKKLVGVNQINQGVAGTRASDEILILRNDADTFMRNAPEGVDEVLYANKVEDKLRSIENSTRAAWGKITGGDEQVAGLLSGATKNDPTSQLAAKTLNLEYAGSVGQASEHIATIERAAIKAGKFTTEIIDGVEVTTVNPTGKSLKFMTAFGDDMGKLTDEAPTTYSIADHMPKGTKVEVTPTKVTWGKNSHEVKLNQTHDAAKGSVAENEARHMWANDPNVPSLRALLDKEIARKGSISATSKRLHIGVNDLALLGKAYREGFTDFLLTRTGKTELDPLTGVRTKLPDQVISTNTMTREQLLEYIATKKERMAARIGGRHLGAGEVDGRIGAIAKRLDVSEGWLNGADVSPDLEKSVFGLQGHRQKWFDKVHANTPNAPDISTLTPWKEKHTVGMVYSTERLEGMDSFAMDAMVAIKQRQKLQASVNENASAKTLGANHVLLPEMGDDLLGIANRTGAGPTFISYANGNYGSLASAAEYIGSLVTKWTQANVQKVGDAMASVNYKLVNDAEATAELATVFSKIRAAGSHKYVIHDGQVMLKSYRDHLKTATERAKNAVDDFDELAGEPLEYLAPQGIEPILPVNKSVVLEWLGAHGDLNNSRIENQKIRNAARGKADHTDGQTIYPPQPSPDKFTHHAFVIDDSVRNTGHVSMLYATDAKSLEMQINEARRQGFTTLTSGNKGQAAEYFRAKGEYEYSKGINDNYIDTALARTGASASHFPITGSPGEMVQDWMQWHVKQENISVRDAVELKYSRQIGTISKMSEAYEGIEQSRAKGFIDRFKTGVSNPYNDYVKTMMGVSRQSEYPVWKSVNDAVERAGSKFIGAAHDLWDGVFNGKANQVQSIEQINNLMQQYGMKVAATDAQMQAWTKHPAGQGAISKFIGTQNAILSTLTLRLDPVNALNNAAGSTILTGTETASVLRAIRSGNADAVGQLTSLMEQKLPGTQDIIKSPAKLIASAYADILGAGGKKLIEKYKGQNLVVDQVQQFRNLLETVTIDGTETAAVLESKSAKAIAMLKTFGDVGEKWTGNKFAEQLNRAVSARIMDKITDVAVQAGVMDSRTAATYINTFVNRTQANIIASQRPQMFQGPIGQAIGLFQSYQFNIMQQLLRHVGEGSAKDALTLLGMQSTVYGASGLPAYQAINTHIIGNASGNKEHRDIYSAINEGVGKDVGDWFTYGLASNIFIHPDLKINLYSRGDINPRSLSIVPTSLAEMPVAGAWVKAFSSASGTLKNISGGGDIWNSLLTGVEQQGISRPMKGLAQALRGLGEGNMSYSASASGNVIAANDFFSLANLARVSGAKPFDEAVAQDAMFRVQTYQSKDKAQRDSLGGVIKTVIGNGKAPSQEQMEGFMESYAKIGGTQTEFSKWYAGQLKSATTPQVNKIVESVSSPYSKYMQEIMGGRVLFNTPGQRPAIAAPSVEDVGL